MPVTRAVLLTKEAPVTWLFPFDEGLMEVLGRCHGLAMASI